MKIWLVVLCWTFICIVANANDVPGSTDLSDINRPVGAKIVRYSEGVRSTIRLPLERVERVNNRLVIDKELYIEGNVVDITYQLSPREAYAEYFERIIRQLEVDAEILFVCRSRACGISGLWANTLFKVRELYGPNSNQKYAVARLNAEKERYLSIYGMERGNRRQYVHLRLVESNLEQPTFQGFDELVSESRVVLPVEFAGDRVSPESRDALVHVASELVNFDASSLAVVAFSSVTPGGSLDQALRKSQARADHVKALLAESGLNVAEAKGLGPLVPAGSVSPDRVELVKFQ